MPHHPLLFPVHLHRDAADVLLLNLPASSCRSGQEQDLFLNVRCQVEERQDLSQSRWRNLGVLCQRGLVGNLSGA